MMGIDQQLNLFNVAFRDIHFTAKFGKYEAPVTSESFALLAQSPETSKKYMIDFWGIK